ncbi:MAG: hypothetical protein ACKO7W_22605 [Elainella sp.]
MAAVHVGIGHNYNLLDKTTRRQVTVTVNDGNEYLIALKDIDWDDL